MRDDYDDWLEQQGYAANTRVAQLHRVKKVEQFYGSLDELVQTGEIDRVLVELTYSTEDERRDRPNPSKLDFNGNIRNNLASYRSSVRWYLRFLEDAESPPAPGKVLRRAIEEDEATERQKLSLERDMQLALRREISSLSEDLAIIDEGVERAVASGFIDILCEDSSGTITVIELKAGKTDARVIAQTLGYMGDLMEEEPGRSVTGIIVAHDFDSRTRAAARAIPNLRLVRYHVSFTFAGVDAV